MFLLLSNLLTSVVLGGTALGAALQSSALDWQRAAELSCDRAALLVVQVVGKVYGHRLPTTKASTSTSDAGGREPTPARVRAVQVVRKQVARPMLFRR